MTKKDFELIATMQIACRGAMSWPAASGYGYKCPDCEKIFKRDELRGRDDHCPPHFVVQS